jgi:hypothetical protein
LPDASSVMRSVLPAGPSDVGTPDHKRTDSTRSSTGRGVDGKRPLRAGCEAMLAPSTSGVRLRNGLDTGMVDDTRTVSGKEPTIRSRSPGLRIIPIIVVLAALFGCAPDTGGSAQTTPSPKASVDSTPAETPAEVLVTSPPFILAFPDNPSSLTVPGASYYGWALLDRTTGKTTGSTNASTKGNTTGR